MNRATPHRIPIDGRITRAIAAAVILLAMLPMLTRAADAIEANSGPTIDVTMHSWPAAIWEPGRKAAFGIEVTNTSPEPVTITAATESLDGSPEYDLSAVHGPILHTTCNNAVTTVLAPGDTYHCNYIVYVGGDVGDILTNTATITVQDDEGNTTSDQAEQSYEILDSHPTIDVTMHSWPAAIWEPGRKAAFGIEVTNTSPEPVTITAATESLDGSPEYDLSAVHGPILHTTCNNAVTTVLAPGDTYHCNYIVYVGGDVGDILTNTATITVQDDEGNTTSDQAEQSYEILDSHPTIDVTKSADLTSVTEPGADVTYTTSVTNTSPEPTQILAVVDSIGGTTPFDVTKVGGHVLATTCDDAIGTTLAPGATSTCEFTLHVAGDAGDVVGDAVTFIVADDEQNEATGTAEASVEIADATPTIEVDKATAVESVIAPGAEVEFTVEVTNTSVENTTITTITDQVGAGDPFDVTTLADPVLATTCDDAIGATLNPGGTYTCKFTVLVASDAAGSVADTVRVTAVDNEENVAAGEDGETVEVTLPAVEEPEPEPTIPAAPTTTVAPTGPAAQVSPATQAPTAQATAASPLAVTGRNLTPYAVIALLLVIGGVTLVGYSRGRRASRLDG